MGAMESQITNFTIVYSTIYSGADQENMFPFDDVIMNIPVSASEVLQLSLFTI